MDAAMLIRMKWDELIEHLARLGYICKGVVYVIIGLLAAATAVGRGQLADRQDAFRFILDQPFGRVSLMVIVVGLLGYAFWRLSSGIADSEGHGSDAKGVAIRTGSVVRGLFYGTIAVELARQVFHHSVSSGSGDSQARHWTARVMDRPFGRWFVGIAGACIIGYAGWQFYRAVKGTLSKKIRTGSIPPWLLTLSRFGLGARAIVFTVIGVSLIRAAIHHSPGRVRGTTGAMRMLAAQPFGHVLLVLIGIGLAAYGVYAFVNARYRVIEAA